MSSTTPSSARPPSPQVLLIVWAALLASQVIYALMAFKGLASGTPSPLPSEMVLILSAVAIGNVVISIVVPRLMLSNRMKQNPPRTEQERLGAVFPALIVRYAMYEAVAMFGLVLALTGSEPAQFAPFFGAGFVLMILNFPSEGYRRRLLVAAGDESLARGFR